jgi:hypothetical protein
MHFLVLLVMVLGLVSLVLSLLKLTSDLSQESIHESPAFLETPGNPASAVEPRAKATEAYQSRRAELSDTR